MPYHLFFKVILYYQNLYFNKVLKLTNKQNSLYSIDYKKRVNDACPHHTKDDVLTICHSHFRYSTLASARASHEIYKNQPGRIENYVPGKSSVVDKEAKQV